MSWSLTADIFSKRATVEERTAFLQAEEKAGSCEKRDGYYFFKYQNFMACGNSKPTPPRPGLGYGAG